MFPFAAVIALNGVAARARQAEEQAKRDAARTREDWSAFLDAAKMTAPQRLIVERIGDVRHPDRACEADGEDGHVIEMLWEGHSKTLILDVADSGIGTAYERSQGRCEAVHIESVEHLLRLVKGAR